MFGIGFWEMLMIAGLALVAVGPERLPGMIKTVARLYRQARRAAQDIRQSTGIDDVLRDDELKELAQLRNQKVQLLGAPGSLKPAMAGKPLAPAKPLAATSGAEPLAGKPMAPLEGTLPAGKPILGKPSVPTIGLMDSPGVLRGLTLEERRRELPLEGVDLAHMRSRLAARDVRGGEAA